MESTVNTDSETAQCLIVFSSAWITLTIKTSGSMPEQQDDLGKIGIKISTKIAKIARKITKDNNERYHWDVQGRLVCTELLC